MLNVLLTILAVTLPPVPADRISDQGHFLQDPTDIAAQIQSAETQSGVELAVVTFDQLDETPRNVAIRTIGSWNLSTRSVVLLVSRNPRKIYIQPGAAFDSSLDRSTSERIASTVIAPHLRAGEPQGGILAGLQAITSQVTAAAPPAPVETRTDRPPASDSSGWVPFALLAGAGLGLYGLWRIIKRQERNVRKERDAAILKEVNYPRGVHAYGSASPPSRFAPGATGANGGVTVVQQDNGPDLLTTVLVADALTDHHHHESPPAPTPKPTIQETYEHRQSQVSHHSSSDDSSSSFGGGGSSFDSGSFGGGGFDGGSGGGGSDW